MNEITEIAEALKFFGLNENYTEEKLKKVYHKLAKLYHPDKNGPEEKMKLINHHYEILRKNLKDKNNFCANEEYNNSKQSDIDIYRDNLINIFEKFINKSGLDKERKNKTILEFKKEMQSINDKSKLDLCYNKYFKICYERLVEQINNSFKIKLEINNSDFKLDFKRFCDLLDKKIANLYINKLNEIVAKYQLCTNYNNLEKLIKNKLNEAIKKLNNKLLMFGFKLNTPYDKLLIELDIDINNIFKTYFNYLSELNSLLNKTDNQSIKNEITDFIEEFNENVDFDKTNKFIKQISKKLKELEKLKQIKESLDNNDNGILYELKKAINDECDFVPDKDAFKIVKNGKIVGFYFPKTDTMNILIKDDYNLSWLVFSSKFNVIDNGMYQEADAVWLIKDFNKYHPYNLVCNNMFLSPCESHKLDIYNIDSLGNYIENSSFYIDLLNFDISYDLQENYHDQLFNHNTAILNTRGPIKKENGSFYKYIKSIIDWYYSSGNINSYYKAYLYDLFRTTNHFPLTNIKIEKKKTKKLKYTN